MDNCIIYIIYANYRGFPHHSWQLNNFEKLNGFCIEENISDKKKRKNCCAFMKSCVVKHVDEGGVNCGDYPEAQGAGGPQPFLQL